MRGSATVTAVALLAGGCAAPAPRLVPLSAIAPSVRQDIRYARADNFVGAPVDGYRAGRCWLTAPAAQALGRVQARLERQGLSLVVFDCYRPRRAVAQFLRWAADPADQRTKPAFYPRVPKAELVRRGYVAARSGHSRGSTVDVTLGRRTPAGLVPLDMGTPFDFFDPRSHVASPEVTPAQRRNRLRLRRAMEAGGFRAYELEWWHFTLQDEPYPDRYFDVPVE